MKTKSLVLLAGLAYGLLNVPIASADTSFICTPTGVATFAQRIHVRCSAAQSGIAFFAYRSSDATGAARNLSLASSALIAGRNLRIFYNPADLTGSAIGCGNSDCRLITGMEML
jgi:hypothetical protein